MTNVLDDQQVSAVITAMTESEKPYVLRTLLSVANDPFINTIFVCVELGTTWAKSIIEPNIQSAKVNFVFMEMALLGEVRNNAIKLVETKWVAFCDGDDTWGEDKTRVQLDIANKKNADFVGCDHVLIDDEDRVCAYAMSKHIPMPSSWLVKTEVMRKFPFDNNIVSGSDGDWWIRTQGEIVKVRLPECLLNYRVRAGSLSKKSKSKAKKQLIVDYAQNGVLRFTILSFTKMLWLINRRSFYVWDNAWGNAIEK